jgi:hypothetical protein
MSIQLERILCANGRSSQRNESGISPTAHRAVEISSSRTRADLWNGKRLTLYMCQPILEGESRSNSAYYFFNDRTYFTKPSICSFVSFPS